MDEQSALESDFFFLYHLITFNILGLEIKW